MGIFSRNVIGFGDGSRNLVVAKSSGEHVE
jgi:hypothetical protein